MSTCWIQRPASIAYAFTPLPQHELRGSRPGSSVHAAETAGL